MQVSMVSLNNIPEVSVKQNSSDTAVNGGFKSAVNTAMQNGKVADKESKLKSIIGNSDKAKPVQGVKEDNSQDDTKDTKNIKDTDQSEDLSVLISQLLNGKIDLSELTSSIKEDIESAIKSNNLEMPQIDDKKLSDILNNLLENLLKSNENINDTGALKLTDDKLNTVFPNLNDDIIKMLQVSNTSDSLNEDVINNVLNKVDANVLSDLNSKISDINLSDAGNSNAGTLSSLQMVINNVVSKPNPQHIQVSTNEKADTDQVKHDYKPIVYNLSQSLKEMTSSSKQSQSQFSSDDKNHNLGSSENDFLKGLLADDKDDKFSKVSNFMTQFNAIKTNVPVVNNSNDITINESNLSNDMFKAITYMDSNGIKDLTVKIAPKELGEVTIKLTMENGVMKANITASNKDAYNLLNSSVKEISDKLQDSNIKIQNFNIDVYNGDTTFFKDGSNRESRQEYKGSKKNEAVSGIMSDEPITDDEAITDDSSLNTLV